MTTSLIAVYTTVASREDARRIGRQLVETGLVACAQIEEIESLYVWEGRVVDEPEFRILLKTTTERQAEVERTIRSVHPYALPAIHAVAIDAVDSAYAEWVARGSSGAGGGSTGGGG